MVKEIFILCFLCEPSISTMNTASYDSQSTPRTRNTTVQSTVTSVNGKVEQHKGNDTNIGVTIGLLIGLCLVVICGIILSICVLRRYRHRKAQNHNEAVYQNTSLPQVCKLGEMINGAHQEAKGDQNEYMTLQHQNGLGNQVSEYATLSSKKVCIHEETAKDGQEANREQHEYMTLKHERGFANYETLNSEKDGTDGWK